MKVLVSGATGTIGRHLVSSLGEGAVALSRDPARAGRALGVPALAWDGATPLDVSGYDAIVHLAGESVAEGRWTAEKKRRIEESRTVGTRAMVDSIRAAAARPRVLVCASAVGFYGSRGDEVLTEESAPGKGFLSDVCVSWEREALLAEALGVRVVLLRIGFVLAREGGGLQKMMPVFKLGIAGKLGRGTQWMPWIHVDDVVGLIEHALRNESVRGPLNAAAPLPATNAEFTRSLARALGRPAFLAAPRWALSLALGETAEVVLASQRVQPAKALATGYVFQHATLDGALADLLTPAGQHRDAA